MTAPNVWPQALHRVGRSRDAGWVKIIERTFDATLERVWDLWTSEHEIALWWMPEQPPEITELIPYRRVAYRSVASESDQLTVVDFEATDRGTRVLVSEWMPQPSHPRSFAMSAA